ncbi:hypothetical protein JVU11DRAFT_403 [Chiua virens]|nr:hypothetical protein JVU11DRAFT_403 [Chiua virens]
MTFIRTSRPLSTDNCEKGWDRVPKPPSDSARRVFPHIVARCLTTVIPTTSNVLTLTLTPLTTITTQDYPPPVGADTQLWGYFAAVDTNRSGHLSIRELQNALVNGNWTKFDLDTVKMLMNMFDTNRTGRIGFSEFTRLWNYISEWQGVFRHFDRDHSGTIERRELADALRNFGYKLSPPLLNLIEYKYVPASDAVSTFGPAPGITFDRFVRACVTIKTLTEAFQRVDTDGDGWAQFSYEDFMRTDHPAAGFALSPLNQMRYPCGNKCLINSPVPISSTFSPYHDLVPV